MRRISNKSFYKILSILKYQKCRRENKTNKEDKEEVSYFTT